MAKIKDVFKNSHENAIAYYCAVNNKDFNLATAYDLVLKTFERNPITISDDDSESTVQHNVTTSVARWIEFQPKTIERIAAKAELKKIDLEEYKLNQNIKVAKNSYNPDLNVLTDNLYKLNIVDKHSYLALVCFLMQLRYSRDNEVPENDKTCVFFNGVARNGKSATAQAICEVESQYGKVFKAQSGKMLESTHEEQVWKSHLNYFDEIKPTDIDRNLLLIIVNGGNVELNPKNKPQYNYHVNTNNIFTSNDQISLKQRRVSIIKFGNRLNGRPLGVGTLKDIVNNIMNSLPDFNYYYDIYDIVSVHNENRINPLAISNIITFLDEKFGFVDASDERVMSSNITFAPHDIFNCVKDTFSKQILTSERKEAIRTALNYLEEQKLILSSNYSGCSTKYYCINARSYLKIMETYNKENTADEENTKITKDELRASLSSFFDKIPMSKGATNTMSTKGE